MSMEAEPGHGNSPAAWAAVVVMLVAITIGTLAFWFDLAWLVWASVGLLIVGALVGLVLKRLGYGVGGARVVPSTHGANAPIIVSDADGAHTHNVQDTQSVPNAH